MENRCFNCKYFMSCNKSDPQVRDCKYFEGREDVHGRYKQVIRGTGSIH